MEVAIFTINAQYSSTFFKLPNKLLLAETTKDDDFDIETKT